VSALFPNTLPNPPMELPLLSRRESPGMRWWNDVPNMSRLVNDARAVRVAELMNDYRTLQLHIQQQTMQIPTEEQGREGYKVMKECMVAAQRLLSSNFNASQSQGGDAEAQKAQLRR
jgi:hypothetical protein